MTSAVIRFEREGLDGIVAVGSYLSDVHKRFGIRTVESCNPAFEIHSCAVEVAKGSDLLSPPAEAEMEHFGVGVRNGNRRLACYAKIIGPGEISIMTEETKTKTAEQSATSPIIEEFENLPLEKKIANLMRMEAVTLGETLSFVLNSPYKVIEKVGDVMAEFGMKLDEEARKESRPPENKSKRPTAATRKTTPTKRGTGRTPKAPKN
jgi:ferredoxin